MKHIKVSKNDSIDDCLKRLKEMVFLEGTLDEVRRLRAHETPKEKKIRKARRAARMAKYLKLQALGRSISPEHIDQNSEGNPYKPYKRERQISQK
jgi:small subunit ribosomal protein S21